MPRKEQLVYLPNVTPVVALPPPLADMLDIIIDAGDQGVNELQLEHAGHLRPAAVINYLIHEGALFDKAHCEALDADGNLRKNIALYRYRGWDATTEWSDIPSEFGGDKV